MRTAPKNRIATDGGIREAFDDLFRRKVIRSAADGAKVKGVATDQEVKDALDTLFRKHNNQT